MARIMRVICAKREAKYFCAKDWTVDSALIGFEKFDFWHNRFWRTVIPGSHLKVRPGMIRWRKRKGVARETRAVNAS
jgi:hypothetical protein